MLLDGTTACELCKSPDNEFLADFGWARANRAHGWEILAPSCAVTHSPGIPEVPISEMIQ